MDTRQTRLASAMTVKKALTRVGGVIRAEVDYDKRQATVSCDDARVSIGRLARATAAAGYLSSIRGERE